MKKKYNIAIIILMMVFVLIFTSCNTGDTPIEPTPSPTQEPLVEAEDEDMADTTDYSIPSSVDSKGLDINLVWSDEFDYSGIPDTSKWSYEVANAGWVNNELQRYVDSEDNASVENGELTITLQKETKDDGSEEYTSARLITKDKGDWLYGRFEIRAKLPTGKGTWPAIWMMPTDSSYGSWPKSGEIDIMEYVGYQPGIIHGSIHTAGYNHPMGNNFTDFSLIEDEDEYHVYALEWTADRLEFFLDGVSYAVYEDNAKLKNGSYARFANGWEAYPFDKRFYMILNIAYGGDWGGAGGGVDDAILPRTMVVDYVRVYEYEVSGEDTSAPTAPLGITVTNDKATVLPLKWDASKDDVGVSSYEIYDGDGNLLGESRKNAFQIEGLEPETEYTIQISATDTSGNKSELSPPASFTTGEYMPYIIDADTAVVMYDAIEYELMTGVDTEATSDYLGGKNVGWIDSGDNIKYLVQVKQAGEYVITIRASSAVGGGSILVSLNDEQLLETTAATSTGWQDWESITATVTLPEGDHILEFSGSGYNLNWFAVGSEEYVAE